MTLRDDQEGGPREPADGHASRRSARRTPTTAVGRLLRTLRYAAARPLDELAAGAGIAPARLRRLERGWAELEYLEGIRLAKALDLCPNCFRRLLEAAAERDAVALAAAAGDAAPEGATAPEPPGAAA